MSEEQPSELLAVRRRKLEALREAGTEPFPHAYPGVRSIAEVKAPYDDLPAGEETEDRVRVAGRLAARRGQGKAAFLDLVDRTGRLQLHARVDVLGEESLEHLLQLDLGDLLGADGTVFRTRRGELSLKIDGWELLAKSLRPPPEKHHGLTDVETRFRQRELDLIANEEARELFVMRAKIISSIRRRLDEQGFVEVETPVLQPIYGGAAARPFTTHHNELDRTLYLRIATELYLKRLIVGGLERVYELGKDFRNEGRLLQAQPRVHDARVVRGVLGLRRRRRADRAAPRGRHGRRRLHRRDRLHAALEAGDAAGRDRLAHRRRRARPPRARLAAGRDPRGAATRSPRRTRGRRWSTSCSPSTSSPS